MAAKAQSATETKELVKKATKVVKEETPKAETTKAPAKSKKAPTADQIRQKAYEIFLKTGNANEHENWVQAEKELLK
jgi:uncharacterized membrane protein